MTNTKIGVVVITHRRKGEALDAVARLTDRPPVVLAEAEMHRRMAEPGSAPSQ